MKVWVGALALITSLGMFAPGAHAMQDRAAVQAVRVSPDTVELGDPFTLRANVHVPAGRDLRVPATLFPEWGVESLRPVRTKVTEAADGSLQVGLEYDLIPLETGLAATPQLEMTSGEAGPGRERVRVEDEPEDGGGLAERGEASITQITQITQNTQNTQNDVRTGQPVGADSVRRRADAGNVDRLVVSGRPVFVTSPILLDDIAQGLRPRPPADVVGSNWHVPAVLGASLLSLMLLGVGTVQAREWLAARAAAAVQVEAPPETPGEWRDRALAELDRVLARGHHRAGRLRDFYEDAGDAVRAYMAHFDPAWNRSRTTTELMRDLTAAPDWPDPEALGRAMGRGEVAKFAADADADDGAAGVREGAATRAERDWRTIRAWVEASGRAPVFLRMLAEVAGEPTDEASADETHEDDQPNMPGNAGQGGASSTGGLR